MKYSRKILECEDHRKGKYSFYQIFVLAEYMHLYEYVYQMAIKMYFFTVDHGQKSMKKIKRNPTRSLRFYLN